MPNIRRFTSVALPRRGRAALAWAPPALLAFLLAFALGLAAAPVFASVELVDFTATPAGSKIVLRWETATELNNAGFFVRRSTDGAGQGTRISGFIVAEGGGVVGAKYTYDDMDVDAGTTYHYVLEALENDGAFEFHGPVTATLGGSTTATPTVVRSPTPTTLAGASPSTTPTTAPSKTPVSTRTAPPSTTPAPTWTTAPSATPPATATDALAAAPSATSPATATSRPEVTVAPSATPTSPPAQTPIPSVTPRPPATATTSAAAPPVVAPAALATNTIQPAPTTAAPVTFPEPTRTAAILPVPTQAPDTMEAPVEPTHSPEPTTVAYLIETATTPPLPPPDAPAGGAAAPEPSRTAIPEAMESTRQMAEPAVDSAGPDLIATTLARPTLASSGPQAATAAGSDAAAGPHQGDPPLEGVLGATTARSNLLGEGALVLLVLLLAAALHIAFTFLRRANHR